MSNRYSVAGPEGEFEPDSNDQVLRNKQGISVGADMDELELSLLVQLYQEVLGEQQPTGVLRVSDLRTPDGQCKFPRLWPPQTPPGKDGGIMTGRC